jgi:hypothetical protein
MDVLVSAFGYTAADDGEIFLLVAAGGMRVDKGCLAGHQRAAPNDVLFHLLRVHLALSLGLWHLPVLHGCGTVHRL